MRLVFASLSVACALALLAPVPAAAQTVYKWKDARGVTHYSERPPASGSYTEQAAARDPVPPPAAAPQATAPTPPGATPAAPAAVPPAEPDTRCINARSQLARLRAQGPVQADTDSDGTPDRALSDQERNGQVELALSTLKAYNCTETPPAG